MCEKGCPSSSIVERGARGERARSKAGVDADAQLSQALDVVASEP